jgi:hypothetical protein
MAAPKEKILSALNDLVTVTRKYEHGETPHYSIYAQKHLDHWEKAFRDEAELSELDAALIKDCVSAAKRFQREQPEDFEDAVNAALNASATLYRSLPGGQETPPPMPKPKPRPVTAYAIEQ